MYNPIEVGQFTQKDFDELGLSQEDLDTSYQPSSGGVFHVRGHEGLGKTLFIAHFYRHLIDSGEFTPFDGTGNLTFKGKYGIGFSVKKGDALREYLWNLTHIPYKHKIIVISEIDSEFPARSYSDKEQTEIATRMWHTAKLGNYIFYDSHEETAEDRGSTDVIFHKASHYDIFPQGVDWNTQTITCIVHNRLNKTWSIWRVHDVLRTMLIYNRTELTEETGEQIERIRPSILKKIKEQKKALQNVGLSEELNEFEF